MTVFAVIALICFVGCARGEQKANSATVATTSTAGTVSRGKELIDKFACTACHAIPGCERGGSLGPSLAGIGSRPQISGRVPNNMSTMTAYIVDPSSVDPPTRMPPVGATEAEARDIAAFRFTLR